MTRTLLKAQGASLTPALLLMLSLYSSPLQAQLSCDAFHKLLGYAQTHHVKSPSAYETRNYYRAGLRAAVDRAVIGYQPLSLSVWSKVTTPSSSPIQLENCSDHDKAVDALKEHGIDWIFADRLREWHAQATIRSMDPHSDYHLPHEWRALEAMRYSASVGARFRGADNHPVVDRVFTGGNAEDILLPGDKIATVVRVRDSKTLYRPGQSDQAFMQSLFGDEGEELVFTLYRDGLLKTATVRLSTSLGLPIESYPTQDPSIEHLVVADFSAGVADQVEQQVHEAMQRGATSLVLDLRHNPGGLVSEAVSMLDHFLDIGPAVALKDRDGNLFYNRMTHPGMLANIPMVVLVNRFSASASELTAGALKSYERAIVVGEQTFGKGTAQTVTPPSALQLVLGEDIGGALRLTEFQYFVPSGKSPQNNGIRPHIETRDRRLDRHIERIAREARQAGEELILAESDYVNSLPAASLFSFIDAHLRPTNSIAQVLLVLLQPESLERKGLTQQQVAESVLQHYVDQCLSYLLSECNQPSFSGDSNEAAISRLEI